MIIDLSQPYQTGMQVYPGTPEVLIDVSDSHGWICSQLNLSTHAGTHIDAPSHLDPPGGMTIDQYSLDDFVGSGIVYHVDNPTDDMPIAIDDLIPQMTEAKHSEHFMLICTGWDQYWGNERYFKNPFLSPELAYAIVKAGVRLVGLDCINADGISLPTGAAHKILFGEGIPIVENLANLNRLDAGKVFQFCFAPLHIPGGDGAPTRAFAWGEPLGG